MLPSWFGHPSFLDIFLFSCYNISTAFLVYYIQWIEMVLGLVHHHRKLCLLFLPMEGTEFT